MKNPLASGLGKSGRMASWVFAFAAVAGYSYYESMVKNANESTFTKEEQEKWNSRVKDEKAK
eukprot:CAMPEP_0196811548 /NCGR_PEP_ID=MMETSP1362-20130617/18552_1 /TAXON_ID=163516 /ORGANISM="Leptocylindrus danicus, Strain CCMP1856" /LENGTH=61 /DNA_ID=CAMNT_0042186877 /DNA_START=79 /DNA_END=264 /DNA_ORIENTATION=-